ncbi:AI-2E family transporter [Candidatus Igneacidithiobacillus taiwanensis]|uniref:AI-2E family transporter n=1 Tax=Candidatus Igneacidithiobacillus taiwanensis TaxID=1945924 RepID=UPI00289B2075|nr:AI-2E family transporter [Candidatus Igneacidithiobacillus taiwanensis]
MRQYWFPLLFLASVLWLLYLLGPILSPFVIAGVLAYLGNPLVTRLQRWHIPRGLGTTLVFLIVLILLAAIVVALLPMVRAQTIIAINYLGQYAQLLQTQWVPQISQRLGVPLDSHSLSLLASKNASKLAHWASSSLQVAITSGSGVLSVLMNFVLIPVIGFYLLRDWPRLLHRIDELVPRAYAALVRQLAIDSDRMLMAFLQGQLLDMLALGATYSIGLSLVGLKTALLIGLLSGLLSFVPYLGFASGILLASLAMYIQGGTFLSILEVWGVYGVGQILESTIFIPMLVGDRIGLHPVLVIFAVLAGGQLFGFVGLLVALPITAVLIALLRHAHRWYLGSPSYTGAPTLEE